MKKILMAMLVVGLAGCSHATLVGDWAPDTMLEKPPADAYSGADAVVLVKEVKARMEVRRATHDVSEWHHHQAVLIKTEAGLDEANVRLTYAKKAKFLHFSARTITPDGEIFEVGPEAIHEADGKGDEEDQEYQVRVFAFPRVEVGSIVEFRYTVELPWIPSHYSRFVSTKHPVKHYSVELEGPKALYYRVKAYHADGTPWSLEDEGDSWRLRWSMSDIPAASKESYAPHERLREPRWMFGVQGVSVAGTLYERNSDWDHAVAWVGKRVYHDDELTSGFDPKIDVSACGEDVGCKLRNVHGWLNENAPLKSWAEFPGRKLRAVGDSKEATNVEKARAMQKILEELDVKSRVALYAGFLRGDADDDFPHTTDVDRLAIYVPKQDGLDEDLWVDPACEYCAIGEIPYWLRDTRAVVVDYEYEQLATVPTYRARFMPVTGKAQAPSSYTYRYGVDVQPNGDVRVRSTISKTANAAQMARLDGRKKKADDWQSMAKTFAEARIEQAKVVKQTPYDFDTDKWTANRAIEFEATGYAVRDGDSLILPLSFFSGGLDDSFKSAGGRKQPIAVRQLYERVEEATIRIPDGFDVQTLPSGVSSSGPFEVRIEAERDGRLVRIRRILRTKPGMYPVDSYPKAFEAGETFRKIRSEALTFVEQGPAIAGRK